MASACADLEGEVESTDQELGNQEDRALEVFSRHVAAFNANDLDAVMEDFGNHSIVITPDGVFEGLEEIELLFGGLLAEFGSIDNGDSTLTLTGLHNRRDTVYITWTAETPNLNFTFGTDTFVIVGNKIARQTLAFTAVPK